MNQTAYNYSIKILSQKDYSIFKLKKKLIQKDYDLEDIEEVVAKLIHLKYLNEPEYSRNLIISLLKRSYENSYIIQKLALEEILINDTEINKYKNEIGYDTKSEIIKLIDFKMKNINFPDSIEQKYKIKNKLSSFLSSKGFKFDDINEEINKKLKYEDSY
jgi:SOS response regulatory protein OraA/RecX